MTTARRWAARGAVTIAVVGAALVLVGPALVQSNPRLPLSTTPAAFGLAYEPVAFSPPDVPITIRGWLLPAPDAKATLVMVHGGGGDNRILAYAKGLALVRDLVAHGYAVLALDLRNYGESDASPEGQPSFGPREANDVLGALDEIERRAPGGRYGAIGFSMGGATVLYAAARDPRLEAIVSDGAYGDSYAVVPSFVRAWMGIPTWMGTMFLWSAVHLHGMELGAGHPIDVVGVVAPRRVLIVHDAGDPIVPVAHAHRLAAACPSAEIWITRLAAEPGNPFGTHVKSYALDPEAYVERVTAFLDDTFAVP